MAQAAAEEAASSAAAELLCLLEPAIESLLQPRCPCSHCWQAGWQRCRWQQARSGGAACRRLLCLSSQLAAVELLQSAAKARAGWLALAAMQGQAGQSLTYWPAASRGASLLHKIIRGCSIALELPISLSYEPLLLLLLKGFSIF